MKPLEGVRILDFTQFTSGPVVTLLMADLGAEVIRLENPPYGDSNYYNAPSKNKKNSFIASLDHNKRSVLMNLKDPEQKAIFYEMVKNADMVVDNFKAGTMKKLEADFDTLKKINPKIVCASISGYGQEGPWAKRAAYDIITQAVGGFLSLTGERGGRPLKCGFSLADISTGLTCTCAAVAGLYKAKKTGVGSAIDCSMMDVAAQMLISQIAEYGNSGKNPERIGNEHANLVPYGTYLCQDGKYVMLCVHNDHEFRHLCEVLGKPEVADKTGFISNEERCENRNAVNRFVQSEIEKWESRKLLTAMQEQDVVCVPVHDVPQADVMEQFQVRHMNNIITRWEDGTEICTVGSPAKISGVEDNEVRRGSVLGADTIEILSRYADLEDVHRIYDPVLANSREQAAQRSQKMS